MLVTIALIVGLSAAVIYIITLLCNDFSFRKYLKDRQGTDTAWSEDYSSSYFEEK